MSRSDPVPAGHAVPAPSLQSSPAPLTRNGGAKPRPARPKRCMSIQGDPVLRRRSGLWPPDFRPRRALPGNPTLVVWELSCQPETRTRPAGGRGFNGTPPLRRNHPLPHPARRPRCSGGRGAPEIATLETTMNPEPRTDPVGRVRPKSPPLAPELPPRSDGDGVDEGWKGAPEIATPSTQSPALAGRLSRLED